MIRSSMAEEGTRGIPKPIRNGDHHVHEGPLGDHPAVLVKDDGQPLPPQHFGLGQQGLCRLACNESHLIWGSAVTRRDVHAHHGVVEAEQQLQSWQPAGARKKWACHPAKVHAANMQVMPYAALSKSYTDGDMMV